MCTASVATSHAIRHTNESAKQMLNARASGAEEETAMNGQMGASFRAAETDDDFPPKLSWDFIKVQKLNLGSSLVGYDKILCIE